MSIRPPATPRVPGGLAALAYRFALRTYPRTFRDRFAPAMRRDFARLLHAAAGPVDRGRLAAREVFDLLRSRLRADPGDLLPTGGLSPEHVRMNLHDRIHDRLDDLRLATRALVQRPGYSLIVVATLALAVGASAAVYTVIDAVLWERLPFAEPDRLVELFRADPRRANWNRFPLRAVDYVEWRERSRTTHGAEAYVSGRVVLEHGEWPERIRNVRVTPGMFGLLGAQPALGSTLAADAAAADTVVLGDAFWRRAFGADPNIVGATVRIDGRPHRVVGVMPPEFRFPHYNSADVWRSLDLVGAASSGEDTGWLQVVARLRPGVAVEQARQELAGIADAMAEQSGEEQWTSANVVTLRGMTTEQIRPVLLLLGAAVSFLLLIACVNVAGLTLARGLARSREMAVRAAIGAGRRRLARLVLLESLILAALSGFAGTLVAATALDGLLELAPEWPSSLRAASFGVRGVVFSVGLAATLTAAFGLIPALRLSRPRLGAALRDGGRSAGDNPGRQWVRRGLVATQMALAAVLLVGAALMGRSMLNIVSKDLGMQPDGLLTARVGASTATAAAGRAEGAASFARELGEATQALPMIESLAWTSAAPMGPGADWVRMRIDGRDAGNGDALGTEYRQVSANYFDTLGARVIRGRGLRASDDASNPRVAVVSENFVSRFLDGVDPLGVQIETRSPTGDEEVLGTWLIVGVVADVLEYGAANMLPPLMFVPFAQDPTPALTVVLRTRTNVASVQQDLRRIAAEIDGSRPVERVVPLRDDLARGSRLHAFVLALLMSFSGFAVTLAAVGLYGTMSQHIGARTREIAVRRALGADSGRIRAMVLRGAAGLAAAGLGIGLLASLPIARQMAGMMFNTLLVDVAWWDPIAFASVPALLIVVASIASLVPARRAASVAPAEALRLDA